MCVVINPVPQEIPGKSTMITKPEYQQHDEFITRLQKLDELRALAVEPYPHKFTPTADAEALHQQYKDQPVGTSEEAAEQENP